MKQLIFIGFLLVAQCGFAGSSAEVLFTQNKVVATNNGQERVLKRGASLGVGDEIKTFEEAIVNLQYSNGTLVNIGANATYKILAYAPEADVQINAELSEGSAEIQNPGSIKEILKTPIVSLAILGTHINVQVTSTKMTYVQVIEGLVLARNEYLRPGDSVRVTSDRIITMPFPKDGAVNAPLNAAGRVEIATTTSGIAENATSAVSGGTVSTFVATTQVTGTTTTSGTQATQTATADSSIAQISLVCN